MHLYASTAGRRGKACRARWSSNAGTQYEAVLNSKLADLGIEFWTEANLREQGYFKTPDALLQVDGTCDLLIACSFHRKLGAVLSSQCSSTMNTFLLMRDLPQACRCQSLWEATS